MIFDVNTQSGSISKSLVTTRNSKGQHTFSWDAAKFRPRSPSRWKKGRLRWNIWTVIFIYSSLPKPKLFEKCWKSTLFQTLIYSSKKNQPSSAIHLYLVLPSISPYTFCCIYFSGPVKRWLKTTPLPRQNRGCLFSAQSKGTVFGAKNKFVSLKCRRLVVPGAVSTTGKFSPSIGILRSKISMHWWMYIT